MVRAILIGTAVTAAALVSTPSASAEPICAQVQVHNPVPLNTGRYCTSAYPLGTTCTAPAFSWGTTAGVSTYLCVPGVLVGPEE